MNHLPILLEMFSRLINNLCFVKHMKWREIILWFILNFITSNGVYVA